jgi:hypothetical protein
MGPIQNVSGVMAVEMQDKYVLETRVLIIKKGHSNFTVKLISVI